MKFKNMEFAKIELTASTPMKLAEGRSYHKAFIGRRLDLKNLPALVVRAMELYAFEQAAPETSGDKRKLARLRANYQCASEALGDACAVIVLRRNGEIALNLVEAGARQPNDYSMTPEQLQRVIAKSAEPPARAVAAKMMKKFCESHPMVAAFLQSVEEAPVGGNTALRKKVEKLKQLIADPATWTDERGWLKEELESTELELVRRAVSMMTSSQVQKCLLMDREASQAYLAENGVAAAPAPLPESEEVQRAELLEKVAENATEWLKIIDDLK